MLQQDSARWIVQDRTWGHLREERAAAADGMLWHHDAGSVDGDRPDPRSPGAMSAPRSPDRLGAFREHPLVVGTTEHEELIHQIIDDRAVNVVFQPIVNVRTDGIVGFEALSRGPSFSPLQAPDRLFAAAQAVGRAGELDWICRAEAFRHMLEREIPAGLSLFVNVGADSLLTECPEDLLPLVWKSSSELRIFIEISGCVLGHHPRLVLETVRRARAAGWGLSIGETEFSADGLSLLPTLEPDVVKIDHRLIADSRAYAGQAMWASLGEVQRTGATLLVENVEDDEAMMLGRMVGGYHQRGYHHGRPGPLPAVLPVPNPEIGIGYREPADGQSPFEAALQAKAHVSGKLTWAEVNQLMLTLIGPLSHSAVPPVTALLLPSGDVGFDDVALLYRSVLARCPLVIVIGPGGTRAGDWRLRDARMPAGHPLLDHGCVVALSPLSALTVAGRRDVKGLWEVAISDDRGLARQIMRRTMSLLDTLEGGVRHQ